MRRLPPRRFLVCRRFSILRREYCLLRFYFTCPPPRYSPAFSCIDVPCLHAFSCFKNKTVAHSPVSLRIPMALAKGMNLLPRLLTRRPGIARFHPRMDRPISLSQPKVHGRCPPTTGCT